MKIRFISLLASAAIMAILINVSAARFLSQAHSSLLSPSFADLGCQWRTFNQTLDHFNVSDTRSFPQKLAVCPRTWPAHRATQCKFGHVFIYLGNEAGLTLDPWIPPILSENAARYHALIILLEHRYYGESLPFETPQNGNITFEGQEQQVLPTSQFRWLRMEQAMSDTKVVVEAMRKEFKVPETVPNLVLGGSYGGQLAAYHRITYSSTFHAAIASSGPIFYVLGTAMLQETEEKYHQILGHSIDVRSGSSSCRENLRSWFDRLHELSFTEAGRQEAAEAMNMCGNATMALPNENAVLSLTQEFYRVWYLANQIEGFNFRLTKSGIEDGCVAVANASRRVADEKLDPLAALAAVSTWMFGNGTESDDIDTIFDKNECYDFNYTYTVAPDPGDSFEDVAYLYQCCTQGNVLSEFFSSRGTPGTLLYAYSVSDATIRGDCEKLFGSTLPAMEPLPQAVNIVEELKSIANANVVFTNGGLDQWSAGGVLQPISETVTSIMIYENGSHTTDTAPLNWNNTAEPRDYKWKRAHVMDEVVGWLNKERQQGQHRC